MDEANEVSLGASGWVQYADNPRGVSLCRYFWPAEKPKGVLLVVHGHGGHVCFDYLTVKVKLEIWQAGYSRCLNF